MMATNFYGPKKVMDAFLKLLDPKVGRIVNVSSEAANLWLRDQNDVTKDIFTNPNTTWNRLNDAVKANLAAKNFKVHLQYSFMGYGLSKAGLTALTVEYAQLHPSLTVTSVTPGFVDTNMTAGFGAKRTPEEGCKSALKCLFGKVSSGCFYGSDGLRSPLTIMRAAGTPEYKGEENPDPAKYQAVTVLVTGGNSGIGLALCKLLVSEHGCYVFLGSRSSEKGRHAVNSIKEQVLHAILLLP